jgi:hypothetical protein
MAVAYAIGAKDKGATCRICGQPALPAVRLCAQCKAALKRVRHDTVSQQMPMPRRPRGGERYRAALRRADANGMRRSSFGAWRGMRVPLALTAMLAIVGSAGYFIVQQIHAAMPPEVNATKVTDAVSQGIPPAAQISGSQAPSPAMSSISTVVEEPAAPTIKPKALARVVKPVAAPIVAPTPEVQPEPAPAPVVVAAAPPPAVRPPDKMQLLSQAVAQCPADGVLARMVCEQKARVQYCDGYWG